MGHYRSEMGYYSPPPTEAELAARAEAQAVRDRGYSDPIEEEGRFVGKVIRPPGVPFDADLALRWHKPCGQAIFDPEQHDKFCPARTA